MKHEPLDARALLSALSEGNVEFIVVGGLAVGAHGHPRGTKEVDIVPEPSRENLERLADLLGRLDTRFSAPRSSTPPSSCIPTSKDS